MGLLDDGRPDSSMSEGDVDWKTKYYEVHDMLSETRNELDDFHTSSKELEEELERELQRTEKSHQDLKVKLERAEGEREEWKGKFMAFQTTHNTTTTSLQRELDQLRAEHQKIKVQLRELEMGNDDLERTERAVSSSLADVEAKYARALEEKILLEHELLDKAHVEEESQRFKDELRDANAEISILRDQLTAIQERASVMTFTSSSEPSPPTPSSSLHQSEEDLLLAEKASSDLQLSDLTPESEFTPVNSTSTVPETPRPSSSSHDSSAPGIPRPTFASPSTPRSQPRPKYASPSTPSRLPPPRTKITQPTPRPLPSSILTAETPTVPRSRGVQMVSEMRARVKNLEQKIHTRVPRIRMGSTSRPTPPPVASASAAAVSRNASISSAASAGSSKASAPTTRRPSLMSRRTSVEERRASPERKRGDTGWVLVMEDSPSPVKVKDAPARTSLDASPTRTSKVRAFAPADASPPPLAPALLSRSVLHQPSPALPPHRRPQSRLSSEGRSSVGTTATISSIPTPSSRPTSPTFLPLPTPSLYASTSALKRSTGPGGSANKRASLGASTALRAPALHDSSMSDSGLPSPAPRARPTSIPAAGGSARLPGRGLSGSPSSFRNGSPSSLVGHANVTVRGSGGSSRLPASASSSAAGSPNPNPLAQSRIGRPQFGPAKGGRRSAGEDELPPRPRVVGAGAGSRF